MRKQNNPPNDWFYFLLNAINVVLEGIGIFLSIVLALFYLGLSAYLLVVCKDTLGCLALVISASALIYVRQVLF